MQDRARQQTDKILNDIEKQMSRVYATSPALLHIQKEYEKYMEYVNERTKGAYKAYINADSEESRNEAKSVYMKQIQAYTVQAKEYNRIIKEFVRILAEVNQKAIDIANDSMPKIYALNYNQVAEECRKVGIKVNGKQD